MQVCVIAERIRRNTVYGRREIRFIQNRIRAVVTIQNLSEGNNFICPRRDGRAVKGGGSDKFNVAVARQSRQIRTVFECAFPDRYYVRQTYCSEIVVPLKGIGRYVFDRSSVDRFGNAETCTRLCRRILTVMLDRNK